MTYKPSTDDAKLGLYDPEQPRPDCERPFPGPPTVHPDAGMDSVFERLSQVTDKPSYPEKL